MEENNRMGKTGDLFKKIWVTKGTFHTKIGTIKDKNSKDLTEAEELKKRWQEYTEELHKTKALMNQITTMVWSLPKARRPGVWSQVILRKNDEQR